MKRLIPIYHNENIHWGDVFVIGWEDWRIWLAAQPITYTFPTAPPSPENLAIYVNGMMQQPCADYQVVRNGVVMLNAPPPEGAFVTCSYTNDDGTYTNVAL